MTSLQIILPTCAFAVVLDASPAFAQETSNAPANETSAQPSAGAGPASSFTISGSAGVSSQYRFRGISDSDNKSVVQGAITIAHSSGFYLSAWGLSAHSDDGMVLGGTEIDLYGGYSHIFGESGITIDSGVYGYIYPVSNRAAVTRRNHYEVYGDVSKTFGPVTAKAGINFAPNQSYFKDFQTATRHNVYLFGELGFALPNSHISLHSHVGHTGGGLDYAGTDYIDYTVGATYKWKALAFDLSVVGTNISKNDTRPFDLALDTDDFHRAAKTVLVGSVSASF
jgi:uncharacterized protein (TIGR02001 family)